MEKELYAEMAAVEKDHWWFTGRRAIIFSTLERFRTTGKRLLDVGMGTGTNAAAFLKRGFLVDGVEPSSEAIRFATVVAPGVTIYQSPFPSPTIPNGTYDVVTLLDVLEHFDDDAEALRGVTRALSPSGITLITVPAFAFLWTNHDALAHHKRRYTKRELRARLQEAGLEPVFISYYNFFLFPAIVFVRLVTKLFGIKKQTSDFSATPTFLNTPLSLLFGAERHLLRLTPLPWGVSLIAVAKKKTTL